jgi:hypothetical protein
MSYVNCQHWVDKELDESGGCAIGRFEGAPTIAECTACPARARRGLGDVVNDTTKALGIKTCGRCRRWQEKLNEWASFRESAD